MRSHLAFVFFFCLFYAFVNPLAGKPYNYNAKWKEIEKMEKKGLPKSAATKIGELHMRAVSDNKPDQQIKAIIYQLAILEQVEEEPAPHAVALLKDYLRDASPPISAILHSILAESYWSYYQDKRWMFAGRNEIMNYAPEDIATWDLRTLTKETLKEIQMSLEQSADLQSHSISDFPAMLDAGGKEERQLRPTLYDFLAHHALAFFADAESSLTRPAEEFSLSDSLFFQPATDFAELRISSPDSLSMHYHAMLLYQDLIRFHLKDDNPSALVDIDLNRLEFVYKRSNLYNKAQHYEAALRQMQSKYSSSSASALIAYKLAKLLNDQGSLYDPKTSEDYRWNYKTALDICLAAIKDHPKGFGAESCKYLSDNIAAPGIYLASEKLVIPNQPVKARLSLKNLSGAEVSIYKIPNLSVNTDLGDEKYEWDSKVGKLIKKKPLWSKTFRLGNEGDFRSHSYEIELASLPAGRYIIIASNIADNKTKAQAIIGYSLIDCTNINYAFPELENGAILLARRDTGVPLAGAEVKLYSQDWDDRDSNRFNLEWTGTSDESGMVWIPPAMDHDDYRVTVVNNGEELVVYDYYSYFYYPNESLKTRCLLFTDRAMYRPGQTIHVKGVLFETDGVKHNELLPDSDVTVHFWDVNARLVESKTLRTNEYGSFNCSFTAPLGALAGRMSIGLGYDLVSFNVEEYKRPRFKVVLDNPKETFVLDQDVTVQGRAVSYSGFPIDNASVSFRITRQVKYPFWYWWWGNMPYSPSKEIASGILQADEKGEFSLTFKALGDETVLSKFDPYFVYSIFTHVTDIGGETRSGSLTIRIGEKELILEPMIPELVDLQEKRLTITIHATNLSEEPISAQGTITVSRLQAPDHVQKNRIWPAPDRAYLSRKEFLTLFPNDAYMNEDDITTWEELVPVWTGNFATPELDSLQIKDFADWEPGAYALHTVCTHKGKEFTATRYFTVYDSGDRQLPYPMADWFVPIKTACEPGETAKVLIGSGYADVSVLLEVEKDEVIVETQRFALDNEQRLFSFPVEERDRGNFFLHFTWFRDGRLYTHDQEITVPWTNKQIEFEYQTFRDKLLPGQDEEWRIKLKDHTGGRITAELLASMYDASLDAFLPSNWKTEVFSQNDMECGWQNDGMQTAGWTPWQKQGKVRLYPYRKFDALKQPYLSHGSYYRYGGIFGLQSGVTIIGGQLHIRGGRANEVNFSVDGMSISEPIIMEGGYVGDFGEAQSGVINIVTQKDVTTALGDEQSKPDVTDIMGVQARANFNETAFFYPDLRTDENGEVSFAFTVPEALTRWNFRALALSREFQIGTSSRMAITQKPLMVQPNAPRFFREGDKFTFTAKVTSLDDSEQSGYCQLYLFDAITLRPVEASFSLRNAQQAFSVKKGMSASLNWELEIPLGISAVTYKVVAKAGDFSDGEENTIPVLSNRILVTESLPLPVLGNSSKTFVLDKLLSSDSSETLNHHKLTLEYTSNTAWLAVQALPYLMEYPYDCNEQIFSRFYAICLASHLATTQPQIQRVFEAWKSLPDSLALLSNLEKNQDLKSLILEETPWVVDAKNETQCKQRIGLLFDLNTMANGQNSAFSALLNNQSMSGAWPWFQGMRDSWWVTQYIVEGFGHLRALGVSAFSQDHRIWNMTKRAVLYLDGIILREYQQIKEEGDSKADNLGYLELHYLYARSFFDDIPLNEDVQQAVRYFRNQANKYWLDKDIYGQGLIALALHRSGDKSTPAQIVASLKEHALHDEELGMWWSQGNQGWFWYQAPIETQALMIEAFDEIAADTLSVDAMRTWLLKNKQTNHWKTTKATAEACYALLHSGTEWLDAHQQAEIIVGGKSIDPYQLDGVNTEAGTGYFKTSWLGSAVTPQMAEISVTNPNAVSSWGALYWQYFEDLDRITPTETPLSLKKQLFIERTAASGILLEPIGADSQLGIGDKVIVRIELRSDRDMEYVHMKDMRGAGFEPLNVLSHYKWSHGLGYYETTGDAATNFFFDYLPKGTYIFEYPLRVFNKGDFSTGIATIQCMYAPEFSSHSEGIRLQVK